MWWRDHRTADLDGRFKFEKVGLREEDLAGCQAELPDLVLCELDLLGSTVNPKP